MTVFARYQTTVDPKGWSGVIECDEMLEDGVCEARLVQSFPQLDGSAPAASERLEVIDGTVNAGERHGWHMGGVNYCPQCRANRQARGLL